MKTKITASTTVEIERPVPVLRQCGPWSPTADYVYNLDFVDAATDQNRWWRVRDFAPEPLPRGKRPSENPALWIDGGDVDFAWIRQIVAQTINVNNLTARSIQTQPDNSDENAMSILIRGNEYKVWNSRGELAFSIEEDATAQVRMYWYKPDGTVACSLGRDGIESTVLPFWSSSNVMATDEIGTGVLLEQLPHEAMLKVARYNNGTQTGNGYQSYNGCLFLAQADNPTLATLVPDGYYIPFMPPKIMQDLEGNIIRLREIFQYLNGREIRKIIVAF